MLDIPAESNTYTLPFGAPVYYTARAILAHEDESLVEKHMEQLNQLADEGYCIAVDFDGTICENKFPRIGKPKKDILGALQFLQALGIETILWTCREGKLLEEAVEWCEQRGLRFTAVNDNTPKRKELYGNNPRKVGADEYWDDKAFEVY